MKKLCIYHGQCADGFGAALAVRNSLGDGVEFFAGRHGHPPPDVTDREVIIVDFSYKRDVLLEMAKTAKFILILDHHKSAEEDLVFNPQDLAEGGYCPIEVIFDMDRSGAVIAWEYCNPNTPVPQLLLHIQDRDLWRFEIEGTKEISAAIFSYPYDFEVWEKLLITDPQELRIEGEILERKQAKDINEFIESAAHRTIIAGHDVPVLNTPYFWASEAGHIMGENEPFAATYYDKEDGRSFSLRSRETGLDVSEIATSFGGGGHKHASGFKLCHEELWRLSDASNTP
jgi:oligoribonuclease NrnB/cAMP/cGMP phosphodiesterase (DHH superfamily)